MSTLWLEREVGVRPRLVWVKPSCRAFWERGGRTHLLCLKPCWTPRWSPLWVEPMAATSKLSLLEERLRPTNQLVMNLRLPKWMVLLREKSQHDRNSPLAVMVSTDEGTIGTSGGKARYKSPFLARLLSVFSAPIRIGWSRSRVPILRWSCELQSTQWSILVQAPPWR
jgi:hypothetical protein